MGLCARIPYWPRQESGRIPPYPLPALGDVNINEGSTHGKPPPGKRYDGFGEVLSVVLLDGDDEVLQAMKMSKGW